MVHHHARTRVDRPHSFSWSYRLCLHGHQPGEVLSRRDGDRLIAELWALGWTDTDIAVHTRWTDYVVARKRDRLGLAPHRVTAAHAA